MRYSCVLKTYEKKNISQENEIYQYKNIKKNYENAHGKSKVIINAK